MDHEKDMPISRPSQLYMNKGVVKFHVCMVLMVFMLITRQHGNERPQKLCRARV